MHSFNGKWITDAEFSSLTPRNVFGRQTAKVQLDCTEHRNCHILFRKTFTMDKLAKEAKLFISADDYYKVYINGQFVGQGPAMCYHFRQNYNEIHVGAYLCPGENTIAVHTYYQGLINRVWQSGDNRHGMILDLVTDGKCILKSDESFKTHRHTGYSEMGTAGYATQILERYDSNAPEAFFYRTDFNDSEWEPALLSLYDDHVLMPQETAMLAFEKIKPVKIIQKNGRIVYDFGANYVGYFSARAKGKKGDVVYVRAAQELTEDGAVRFALRCNCQYEEEWILSDGESVLDWFDYKSFRYIELECDESIDLEAPVLLARHYPFNLHADMKPQYKENEKLASVWNLCVRSQKYGVQEAVLDCMDREKGFYVGDGCYSALTHMVLSGDDSIVRKLIDDSFASSFITDTLTTCLDCSFVQEIAEYPLILVSLVLWHYQFTSDKAYLSENFEKTKALLEAYRKAYEKEYLLTDMDKWSVVEWPPEYRDGYDVELHPAKVCEVPHVVSNAYYLQAIKTANKMAEILQKPAYRDIKPLETAFYKAFYDAERHLFCDSTESAHASIVGNSFAFGFGLVPDRDFRKEYLKILGERKISTLSFFASFPVLGGLIRDGEDALLEEALSDENAWYRMVREEETSTVEGWGIDCKDNASAFHMTMTYAAFFLADIDHKKYFI